MRFVLCYRAYFQFWKRYGFKMLFACLDNMHGNGLAQVAYFTDFD